MFQKEKHFVSQRKTLCFTKGNTFDNLLFVFFN